MRICARVKKMHTRNCVCLVAIIHELELAEIFQILTQDKGCCMYQAT